MTLDAIKRWLSGKVYLQPLRIPPEIERLSHFPVYVFLALVLLFAAGVSFTAYFKTQGMQNHLKAESLKTAPSTALIPNWFEGKQQEGLITASPIKPEQAFATDHTVPGSGEQPKDSEHFPAINPTESSGIPVQHSALEAVLQAKTTVFSQSVPEAQNTTEFPRSALPDASETLDTYLPHTRQAALSNFEIKAGTIIPAVMFTGIQSDLPGQILAQVSQNVYDSATGQILLIPQGAKLVGQYEQLGKTGQKRILVLWNRLIYPDASSVTLDHMPGVDTSGYAGFQGSVNTHFWPTFGKALMLSAITGGIQLSQPQSGGNSGFSAQQLMAGSLGQQMAQLGMGTVRQVLAQAPTITVAPGYRFSVMVNRDMILTPYPQEAEARH